MKKIITLISIVILISSGYSQNANSNFRKELDIIHYSINLKIIDFHNREISGFTKIKLRSKKDDLKNYTLELIKLNVDSVFIFDKKVKDFSYNGEILKIPTINNSEDDIELTVYYQGNPVKDADWGGFFFSDTSAYNIGVGMAAEPNSYGRVWFPCIDSFEEKATFDFNITVPEGFKAVCSGVLTEEKSNSDITVTFSWKMEQEIPPYLASVAVAEYDVIEDVYKGIKRDIPISLYIFPEDVANAKFSFQNLPNALRTYEHNYGEYVWDRVGYVEVPFMSGAMEHVCNIAYPEYAIDSTLFKETLMAHELSHHWFGNLVTCKTSGDMWLNEGFAVFSEALFKEGKYGKEAYKEYVRENHVKVLTVAHINDNGYRAVYGVPHEYTYGTTVYDKGGDVAHCLRGYLGDDLFFKSISNYIEEYSYKAASTFEFRDFLSENSGVDLNDFFDTWVFEAGFPHFSIHTFHTKKLNNKYEVDIIINQNIKERDFYGLNNFIDLTFVDKDLNLHTERITMSGPKENISVTIPFEPINVFLDLEEKIADATVDNYKIFKGTANFDFQYTDFSILIKSIKGKTIVQSIMNHIEAENSFSEKYIISKEKYWEIRGALTEKMNAEGTFYINMTENKLDADFDELVLLYRTDSDSEFKEIETKALQISDVEGILILEKFKFGQYAAGIKNSYFINK